MSEEPADYRVFVCGCRAVVCEKSNRRWCEQLGCRGAVKDPHRDQCWYVTADGICERDRMEHEAHI